MGVGVLLPPCELRFTLKARLWVSDLCRHWAGPADSTARLHTHITSFIGSRSLGKLSNPLSHSFLISERGVIPVGLYLGNGLLVEHC